MSEKIVITGSARTPMGGFQGVLSDASAAELGAAAIAAAIERSQIASDAIDEVIMGCVLSAGQGQAPARQASLGAGIPLGTGCTTINKMCGSGMKATMLAHDLILAGSNRVMIAGGQESMSNAPYLVPKARAGLRMGHGKLIDHMFLDGLEDAYDKGCLMGTFADNTADKYKFTREQQDEFAITSLKRAQAAIENGAFKDEITPVVIKTRKGDISVDTD
jgi:acetyl-CoA C-acetyltransferase